MLGKAPTPKYVVGLLAFGVVFAMPLAAAFGMGVDAHSVPEMKNAGAKPAYGQTWVGAWMRSSGWNGFETDMRTMRDNGVTPVVMWYYWGDGISVNCVKYGCNGNSKSNWDSMAKDMATRAKNIMGDREFLVVLEPEFNKNGISDWEDFDGMLAAQAYSIKGIAPKAKIVTGFGHWGGWDKFDRAMAASSYSGFQILRGSTRDSTSLGTGVVDQMLSVGKQLKSRWGKDVIVFDLGVATYGGWEWVQEKALQNVLNRRGELDNAGIRIIVWRYVYDNNYSSGYFGAAESTWGVKYSGGGKKAGYDELVKLIQGGSGSTTGTTPAPAPTTGTFDATFTGIKVETWWVQASVTANQGISKVEARVNGGAWQALTKYSYGYAKSINVPSGAKVEFKATSTSGATDTHVVGGTSTGTTPTSGTFDASFSGVKVEEWWVQASVTGNQGIAKVEARVNGGAWQTLTKYSYGYAKSINVPAGGKVEFRATSTSGATDTSSAYYR